MRESYLQEAVIQWCQLSLRKNVVYWSTPNERNPKNMGNLMKMGLLGGVADLIFISESVLIGLQIVFVELKAPKTYKMGKRGNRIIDLKGGTQSDKQKLFQERVEVLGCYYEIVDNLDDFADIMRRYNLTK